MWLAVALAAGAFVYGLLTPARRRSRNGRPSVRSETVRLTAFTRFQRRFDVGDSDARLATRALHPFDDDHRPVSGRLTKHVRQMSRRFARASKSAHDGAELRELTYVALSTYAFLAREATDPYYKPLFRDAALEAQVELSEERRRELTALLDG